MNTYLRSTTERVPYQFIVSECSDAPDWDDFVATTMGGRQAQSSPWADVKTEHGWQGFRLLALRAGLITAGTQAFIFTVKPLGRFALVAHGPVMRHYSPELVSGFIDALLHETRRYHVRGLVVQPPPCGEILEDELLRYHFHPSPFEVAPTANTVLDLVQDEKTILQRMRRQTRQNVLRSQRDGIEVRRGTYEDLSLFYPLHRQTSERQGFTIYAERYYQRLWERLAQEDSVQVFIGTYEGHPVSTLLVTAFGDRVYAKSSGWSGEEQARRPNEAVFWSAILWAKAAGYHYFDFEGFDRLDAMNILRNQEMPEQWHNTSSFFKYGFGGEVLVYPLAYYYLFNPAVRWTINQIAFPIADGSSILHRLPSINRLMGGVAQRLANRVRTRDIA